MNKAHLYLAASVFSVALAMPAFAAKTAAPAAPVAPAKAAAAKAATTSGFPDIDAAIASLQAMKKNLDKPKADFGGHKAEAMRRIDGAVAELHAAIDYAKKHPDNIKR